MAWLYQDPDSHNFKICFRFRGRAHKKSIKTSDPMEANIILGGVNRTLFRLEQHLLELPPGADILAFVMSDGKPADIPAIVKPITLQELIDRYVAACSIGAMEDNSLATVKLHLRHFVRSFGKDLAIGNVKLADLRRHVERRAKQRGIRKRLLSPITMRKEIASLRAAWNWGPQAGLLVGPFPHRGLKYPKATEKPPFRTWCEIERQIEMGNLGPAEQRDLSDCLYLTPPDIEELLAFVKKHTDHGFIYPMFVFAAHTGARRSEMIRALVTDIDFIDKSVLIHEKKRSQAQRTTRRVPLSALLVDVLRDWLKYHPGGQSLFCHSLEVARSRKTRAESTSLTCNESHDHFQRTLAGNKCQVLRGWHALRHSFASNCAAAGVDQPFVNAWMGHQTEAMVKRYQHLRPDAQRDALALLFGL
jgi:integrase